MDMADIKSDEDVTTALAKVKRGEQMSMRLTKAHAKAHSLSWKHFENSIRILGLKVTANTYSGHLVSK